MSVIRANQPRSSKRARFWRSIEIRTVRGSWMAPSARAGGGPKIPRKVRELFRKQILAVGIRISHTIHFWRRVVGVLHAHLFSFVAAVDWFTIAILLPEALIKTPRIVAISLLRSHHPAPTNSIHIPFIIHFWRLLLQPCRISFVLPITMPAKTADPVS